MKTVTLSSPKGKWILASAVLTSSMAFIDGTALNVVLPSLQKNLGASGSDLFWILNAYLVMLASLMLIGGSLGDRLGHKKVFMYGTAIFIIGSAACGLSANAFHLILFRLLQGAGGAFMIPGSLSIISSSINSDERGKAIGTWSSFTTLVTLGGPVLGGALADIGLWRYIFFINVPIGIVALLILWRHVNEPLPAKNRPPLDILGAVAIGSALALITYGVLSSTSTGHNRWVSPVLLAAGIILVFVFILVEHRSDHPMMPLSLFSNISFSGANLLTFFLYAALSCGMLFLSLDLVQIQGYSQLQSGLAFLPFTLLVLSFAGYAGRLADKYGSRWFLTCGPFTSGIGLLLLSLQGQTNGPADYWTTFLPGMIIFGLGMAFTVAPLTSTVMGAVSAEYSGVASGINNAITRIANVLAYAMLGAFAVIIFSKSLNSQISTIPLSAVEKTQVLEQVGNLGNAKVPAAIRPTLKPIVTRAFHLSFIDAFKLLLRCAAMLVFSGGLIAFFTIRQTKS
ncbi:MFS transporter [Mucilaginibacter sp.]|jgi:EmrB/QacA subfamily drug resistance transporter|uniref:MFS transporter n=1 Tax=Mucilaginibacter sp. TaxID=1882438 RepID=UPI003561A533